MTIYDVRFCNVESVSALELCPTLSNTKQKMKTFELTGTVRGEYGKKAAKALRKENLIPCNLYGHGENHTFAVAKDDVRKLIYTPDTMVVALTIGDVKKMAVVKELQVHPVSEAILHIDFRGDSRATDRSRRRCESRW